jgi:L-threonylcarbamoyladenylate synthase
MRRILLDPYDPDAGSLQEAAEVLKRKGVVAYPTDTLYALAVDPRSDAAVRKLFAVKGRNRGAAIALIAADDLQARQAGPFGPEETALAHALWPGPLTIVVPADSRMSCLLSGELRTLGVRVPAHAVARGLAASFGTCITATSANFSGQRPSTTGDDVASALGQHVDLLLDGGPVPGGPASTIVQVVGGRATLLRAGAIPWDRVLESIE